MNKPALIILSVLFVLSFAIVLSFMTNQEDPNKEYLSFVENVLNDEYLSFVEDRVSYYLDKDMNLYAEYAKKYADQAYNMYHNYRLENNEYITSEKMKDIQESFYHYLYNMELTYKYQSKAYEAIENNELSLASSYLDSALEYIDSASYYLEQTRILIENLWYHAVLQTL